MIVRCVDPRLVAKARKALLSSRDYQAGEMPADADHEAMTAEEEALTQKYADWMAPILAPRFDGGTPPADYPFCKRSPCPYWRGYCSRDPACNN